MFALSDFSLISNGKQKLKLKSISLDIEMFNFVNLLTKLFLVSLIVFIFKVI